MKSISKKGLFLAQLVKVAGKIESEKLLAKMLCYIEKERGVVTGFRFDKNQNYGNYTFEIKDEVKKLQEEGLINFKKEESLGLWGDTIKTHIFVATNKLKDIELDLTKKEKMAIKSIYREYSSYSPVEIGHYDHEIYRQGKSRTDIKIKNEALKETRDLISKHKGDKKSALKEWLIK